MAPVLSRRYLAPVALALAIFAVDLLTPLGYAVWLLYVLPIWWLTEVEAEVRLVPSALLASFCACLIALDAFWSSSDQRVRSLALFNRTCGTLLLFGAAAVLWQSRKRHYAQIAAQQTLSESEARLRKAVSIDTVGVLFFRLDGTMHDANATFERMSGYSVGELRRLNDWSKLTPPEFLDVTRRAAADLAERRETPPYEKQMIRRDAHAGGDSLLPPVFRRRPGFRMCGIYY